MGIFRKKISVLPNQNGYLFKNNKLNKVLEPGIYKLFDPGSRCFVIKLATVNKLINVINQEVLTKDMIALRFSYYITYLIKDGILLLDNFEVSKDETKIINSFETLIHNQSQVIVRNIIASVSSEELNEKRVDIFTSTAKELSKQTIKYGIEIETFALKDITFPKKIQEVFSLLLESRTRSKVDLENARAQVAAARTLKNASALMKDDENIKFTRILETLLKISEKGKHTFILGEIKDLLK